MDELVRTWVHGWALSRDTDTPVAEPYGWRMEVGLPEMPRRHIVTDPVWLEKLVPTVTERGSWLKLFVEELPPLPPGWEITAPGFMMSTELSPFEVTGHEVVVEPLNDATSKVWVIVDGERAAWGQVAVWGADAVVDKVMTEEAHRRKGLGSVVMRSLQNLAYERGARRAVLGGTVEGRALYTSLGWRTECPLTSVQLIGIESNLWEGRFQRGTEE
ncbi:GNAT family N-acetyltransferase [Nonomuraea soli]|uniref:GNAT superfamily N-acetyltransferase n=1 Tax=Nonomuraea soli TaxID=1032476 RepID=A0A7W0CTZ6_9ACTN|nr:GNAT family N-acetyltransferase [Nonomuraea soli]MBA2897134.1 GNAT superfamily N-acetyltransferase [Nonomuraea soli]